MRLEATELFAASTSSAQAMVLPATLSSTSHRVMLGVGGLSLGVLEEKARLEALEARPVRLEHV